MTKETKTYIVYLRASTEKQEESGLGLQAQQRDANYVTSDGIVLATFTEIESRSNSNRPTLKKAIDLAKEKGAILVIAKLDRLTGDSLFLNQLLASELKFICCDNPNATPMVLRFLAAVAQEEVEKTRKRTKDALASINQTIEKHGYYIAKSGRMIKRLGNQKVFKNDQEKSEFYSNIAKQREYEKRSPIGADLAKALKDNGLGVPEIKEKLASRGIILSRSTIYNYING